MKILTILIILLFNSNAFADGKFWISNKIEIGYGNIFISEQVTFGKTELTKNGIASGLKFKINNNFNFRTFYLLENALVSSWTSNHFLGIKLDFKFQ